MTRHDATAVQALIEVLSPLTVEQRRRWLDARDVPAALRREVLSLLQVGEPTADFLEWSPRLGPEPAAPEPAVERIGPYRVVRRIGRGGAGEVYLAVRDDGFEQRVAVKLLASGAGPELTRRFVMERRILARLDHANIAHLIDGGVLEDGRPYLVMEHVAGTPIDRWCDERRLDVDRRLELFRKVCAAVQHAHQRLILHRDVKPANVLVNGQGEPKLVDFGIAKVLDPSAGEPTTVTGVVPMTPAWASPEQRAGDELSTTTDVYSLGALLYVLLCGRRPDAGAGAVPGEPPPPPSAWLPEPAGPVAAARATTPARLRRRLRGDLDRIARQAVHPKPECRYGSAIAVADELDRHHRRLPISARGDSWLYRAERWMARNRTAVLLAALLLLSLVWFGATMAIQAHRLERARSEAEVQRDRAEETSRLLVDVFEVSAPERTRGGEILARELLAEAVSKVRARFQDMPAQRARLLSALGAIHHRLGLYREGRILLREAVELYRGREPAPEPGELALALLRLGELAGDQGDLQAAVEALREALDLRLATLGAAHPGVAEVRTALAATLTGQGRYREAEPLLLEALARQREVLPPDAPALAVTRNELGLLQAELGELEAAEESLRQAIAIWRSAYGSDHPHVATGWSNLGSILLRRGEHAAALPLLRRALAARSKLLGEDHPDIAVTLHNLAHSQMALGRLDDAESTLERALPVHRRVFGEGSVEVAKVLAAQARLAHLRGDLERAESKLEESLRVGRRATTADDPGLAFPLIALARMRLARGKRAEAVPLLREALELRRAALPADSPLLRQTVRTLEELGVAVGGEETVGQEGPPGPQARGTGRVGATVPPA